MDLFLAKWPIAAFVALVIGVLLVELAALVTEQWSWTISEILTKRPDLALWVAFVTGAFLGHIATLVRK